MSIHKLPHLIENPVPDPEPRVGGYGWESGDPYVRNDDPLRRVERYERRADGAGYEHWVEVLECGHDGRAICYVEGETDGPGDLVPRVKRRRCFWCTERGQQAIRHRIARIGK